MKRTTMIALAACAALSIHAALAQDKMMGSKPPMNGGMMKMDPMMGLTPAEKQVAATHMKKMTPAEKAVHMKYVRGMMKGTPDKAIMASMSPAEKTTLQGMMKKMTPAEMKVMTKMKANIQRQGAMRKGM